MGFELGLRELCRAVYVARRLGRFNLPLQFPEALALSPFAHAPVSAS